MSYRLLLLTSCCFFLTTAPALPFCFEEAGQEYAISPLLLESIARTESDMNPRAINQNRNGSRDYGLMQINSLWVRTLGLPVERLLTDACFNTKTGAKVLRGCIDRNGYNWNAVGCYNASNKGKRAKYAWKVFKNLDKSGKTNYTSRQTAAVPPQAQAQVTPPREQKLSVAITDIYTTEPARKVPQAVPELNPLFQTFEN